MIFKKCKCSVSRRFLCIILSLVLTMAFFSPSVNAKESINKGTDYPFVFVEGYGGWGHYNVLNIFVQYWGGMTGDMLQDFNDQGFECYASSVGPIASAWDRACTLYAQLTGTLTDYGKVHAAKYNHDRYGADYRNDALFEGWGKLDEDGKIKKVNFITHSFGGTTVRMLAQLLANGSPEERAGTTDGEVSGLFAGEKTDLIHSITTVACPHNGTTLLFLLDPVFEFLSYSEERGGSSSTKTIKGLYDFAIYNLGKQLGKVCGEDTGIHDLTVDSAAEMNKELSIMKDIYYFSVPTDATLPSSSSDERVPNRKMALFLLWPSISYMGSKTGVTKAGAIIDKSWFNNDGVVNTISTIAPKDEAQKPFNANNIEPGIWNIMDTLYGDHASATGGFAVNKNVYALYIAQMRLVDSL